MESPNITLIQKPGRPENPLAAAAYDAIMLQRDLTKDEKISKISAIETKRLEALSRVEPHIPTLKQDLDRLQTLLEAAAQSAPTKEQGDEIRAAYDGCLEAVFPVCQKYQYWSHQLNGISSDHSLSSISFDRLKKLEEDAYSDPELKNLMGELKHGINLISHISDTEKFRQAFEYYGEAVVYGMLSKHFKTRRVDARDNSMPDFACLLPDGKEFFVEVKSLDIVQGQFRAGQMHEDAMQQNIELEDQLRQGRRVATAVREIAPFKPAFDDGSYDPRSLLTVINTFINKSGSAFKSTQFSQGPTFAFILSDRLVVPGGKYNVAPHYYERGGCAIVSGILWNVCFGKQGWPIFRMPEFEGKPGLEGYMTLNGLLADKEVSFPTGAVIIGSTGSEDSLVGLYDSTWKPHEGWSEDETTEVLGTLCEAYNDEKNSFGQLHAMT